mmetsp:Transcript_38041/g.125483  ORF Transcript_38041/g.125483 Transcript_38041/m.125483 type:complete len:484 (-) Transcript_38041:210-1661(-)
MNATVEELLARLEQLEARVDEHSLFPGASADVLFLLVASLNVFFMQCGFGMLEAGSVTSRSTQAILLKNLLDACLSAFIWWVMGHGIAFDGTNDFIGTAGSDMSSFFLSGYGSGPDSGYHRVFWWFQWTFAAAAGTIVSGAVAERAQLLAYLAYTFILTAVIYPIIVHWCWSEAGWLSTKNGHVDSGGNFTSDAVLDGVIDFAGSGVVHLTGGTAGFFGALIIGPRHGRFEVVYDGSKPPRRGRPLQLPGHAPVLQALGTFILWLGWYGFNAGSQLRIATPGASEVIGRIVVNTTLSAAGSGLVSLAIATLGQWRRGTVNYEVPAICNGILAGLVSITAGCACMLPWAAFLTGFIGAFVYYGASKLMLKLKIDDPLDAFAVHGACGFWGVLAVGVFGHPEFVGFGWDGENGDVAGDEYAGFLYGGSTLFGAQLVALIIEIAWVASLSTAMFFALKMSGILRVSEEVEMAGMDVSKHGGSAYNH